MPIKIAPNEKSLRLWYGLDSFIQFLPEMPLKISL